MQVLGKETLPLLQGVFSISEPKKVEEVSCLNHNPQKGLSWFPQKQVMKESRGMLRDKESQLKPIRMNQQGCSTVMEYGAPIVRSFITPKKLVGNSLEWWF